jgi:hypothetical protein
MSDDKDKYIDPKQNPFIKTTDEDGNPMPEEEEEEVDMNPDGLIPVDLTPSEKVNPEHEDQDQTPDELEKAVMEYMNGNKEFELQIQNGEPIPIFSIIHTADGDFDIIMPNGTTRKFSDLTNLERTIIEHEIRANK